MIHNSGIIASANARRARMNQERQRKEAEKRRNELLKKQKESHTKTSTSINHIGQVLMYSPKEGKLSIIDKDIYTGLLQKCLHVEASIYRNKSYTDIIKDNKHLLKEFAPKMYSFQQGDIAVICLIDKTVDDFKKYCRKNKLKLAEDVFPLYKAVTSMNYGNKYKFFKTYNEAEQWLNSFVNNKEWCDEPGFKIEGVKELPDYEIKDIVNDLTECFINDQYKDNPREGIKQEITKHNYSYAGVIQDSIKSQYGVNISLSKLKEYLRDKFKDMLNHLPEENNRHTPTKPNILDWLAEHPQTFQDFCNAMGVNYAKASDCNNDKWLNEFKNIDLQDIKDWISDHETLSEDYENWFREKLENEENNDIGVSRNDFLAFESVRQSGVTNMFARDVVCKLANITKDTYMKIVEGDNYSKLAKLYGVKR